MVHSPFPFEVKRHVKFGIAVKTISYSVAGCGMIGVKAYLVLVFSSSVKKLFVAVNDGTVLSDCDLALLHIKN